METNQAFAETIRRFKIQIADISRETGIAQESLSRFKNGHSDIKSKNLQKILKSLPPYAQEYFYTLWCRNSSSMAA